VNCPQCNEEVLEIDVRCKACGTALGASGAHRMIGSTVLGQYEVTDVLGQGGMSIVYKAKHKMTEQEVALKILPPELAAHSQVKSRFLEEARALATLDHANIVHLYNFGQENGCFVLAMQLVTGRTWERMILEGQRLDWQTSVRVAIDVLRALEYAHGRGVVHRDMKPSNVLVRAHDGAATVMDFGIAKMTTSTKLTATGQTMGTVRYMSPEQVRGQEVDARTDIYSLGATLFESLTGETPFDGQTHFEIMTKHLSDAPPRPTASGVAMPAVVEDAVMRSLAKRAEDRFETARDMRKALEGALRSAELGLGDTHESRAASLASTPRTRADNPPRTPARVPTEDASSLVPALGKAGGAGKWIALAVGVVLLGAGGGAAWWWSQRAGHTGQPIAPKPTTGSGDIQFVGTGHVTPQVLADAYRTARDELQKYIDTRHPESVIVLQPIDTLIALPRSELCDPGHYSEGMTVPTNCGEEPFALGSLSVPRTLLVSDNPAGLHEAMGAGVAQAVCLFKAFKVIKDRTGDATAKLANEICDLTNDFAMGSGAR
jgi:serine/threonine protein kinase